MAEKTEEEAPFQGLHALLDVIRDLVDRPRWSWRKPQEGEYRGDRPLPILSLIGTAPGDVPGALALRLNQPERDKIAHVVVDASEPPAGATGSLLPLLDEVHQLLERDNKGTGGRLRFQHYRLAAWLTRQTIEPADGRDARAASLAVLRTWYEKDRPRTMAGEDGGLPWWARLLVVVGGPLPFWLWRHRWPIVGRVPRWFMRQPFMVPLHSTTFVGFAERLTTNRRGTEDPEQIRKVLVHAFLRDLRLAYRPRGPRPRRWRRTAYVVLVLDNVTDQGWELLRLVNDVRNEKGDLDPLLVVARSDAPPSWKSPRGTPLVRDVQSVVDRWYRMLPTLRQRQEGEARFVFARLPDPTDEPSDADREAWPKIRSLPPRAPAWLARRGVALAVTALLVAVPVLAASAWAVHRWAADCLPSPSSGAVAVWDGGLGQCVGYSDNSDLVFGSDRRLRLAQLAVFEQNAIARDLHEANRERPLVSIVYFSGLTHPEADPGTDHSVAEELEGLLIRQQQHNRKEQTEPLLRVVVANGGNTMAAAARIVRDLLEPLLRDDPTVLGVIGMDRTVPETETAIALLGHLGTAVVSMVLTGERLDEVSPLYFQLPPGNRVQARAVVEYAHGTSRQLTVYHPPADDAYIGTLVEETTAAVRERAPALAERPPVAWERSPDEVDVRCGRGEIAFYAGREDQFAAFLNRVVSLCGREESPTVVGDDSVIRFVAQQESRDQYELNGLPVSWVDMGGRVVAAGRSCREKGSPETNRNEQSLAAFCDGYNRMYQVLDTNPPAANDYARELANTSGPPWPGQGIGLSYDAAGLFIAAVRRNQQRPGHGREYLPHRAAIAQELVERSPFDGATGEISFRDSRTGAQRKLMIARIEDIGDATAVPRCEFVYGDGRAEPCPG
ncbi:ABC transporter substrate-binding protein [Saccharothrix lopnurensis]|uniref:ABC transporter substrate-binding protein n=1 Tax=Saccharothrix lopnurensis TaxID=1670621 RepID=A0ABW1P7M1_9PSEU